MSGEAEGQPVEVNIGDCRCPGTPHTAGDVLYLRPTPDLAMGLAVRAAIRQSGWLVGDTESAYLSVMIRYGVTSWNIRDADGPVRVTTTAVAERLGWDDGALAVAEKAMELYGETVLAPLVTTRSASVQPTPEGSSTSPNPSSGEASQSSPVPSSLSASAIGA